MRRFRFSNFRVANLVKRSLSLLSLLSSLPLPCLSVVVASFPLCILFCSLRHLSAIFLPSLRERFAVFPFLFCLCRPSVSLRCLQFCLSLLSCCCCLQFDRLIPSAMWRLNKCVPPLCSLEQWTKISFPATTGDRLLFLRTNQSKIASSFQI